MSLQVSGSVSGNRLKFEGIWSITIGYESNVPYKGSFFDENGKLVFSGKFEINKQVWGHQ